MSRARGTTVGYLPQEVAVSGDRSVLGESLSGFDDVWALEREMESVAATLAGAPADGDALTARYGDLQHRFDALGGYRLETEAKTILGGLAASGWHTAAIAMRLAASSRPFGPHPLFGAGVDDLRWLKPVRPGDTIHLEGEVVELAPSRTKPQGIARVKWTAYNQHGEAVYTFNPIAIVPRRPDQAAQ